MHSGDIPAEEPLEVRRSPAHLLGVEGLVVVTGGRARVGPHDGSEALARGDGLWFAADVAHTYAATGAACRLLCWMLSPPSVP